MYGLTQIKDVSKICMNAKSSGNLRHLAVVFRHGLARSSQSGWAASVSELEHEQLSGGPEKPFCLIAAFSFLESMITRAGILPCSIYRYI